MPAHNKGNVIRGLVWKHVSADRVLCKLPGAQDVGAEKCSSLHSGVGAIRAGGFGEDQQEPGHPPAFYHQMAAGDKRNLSTGGSGCLSISC